jgi:CheY-like chemotaxis protein
MRVLHVEDDFADAMLLQHALCEAGRYDLELMVVRTLREARQKLSRGGFDLIVLDLRLPDSISPKETLRIAREEAGDTPVIVLTGSAGIDREAISEHVPCLDKNEVFGGRAGLSGALIARSLDGARRAQRPAAGTGGARNGGDDFEDTLEI